jgi:SAM-dependent methyltransferase
MAGLERGMIEPNVSSGVSDGCLCCGGETLIRHHLPRILPRPGDSPGYEMRWCESCDFGFLRPRPTVHDPKRFGEHFVAAAIEAKPSVFEKVRLHLAWLAGRGHARPIDARLIHSVVGTGKRTASICVFGCREVDVLDGLRDLGHQALGVELDEDACRQARARGRHVVSGSVEAPPGAIRDASFDAVFLNQVLQVCLEPRVAVQNACRLLKPGGHLFAEVPNHGAFSARRYGPAWALCNAGRHLNFLTTRSLSRLVGSTGCDISDIVYRQYVPQFAYSRLVLEREVWDRLYTDPNRIEGRRPPRKTTWDLWTGLVRTIFLAPTEKYEIVGIVAIKRRGRDAASGSP